MNEVKRTVFALSVCQALMMSANSSIIATSALAGLALAPSKGWATLPLGIQFLATTACTFPASLLMKNIGRKAGFVIGLLLAIFGALIATSAIVGRSFAGFCLGAALIGIFNGFGQYYRFAAADVAIGNFRSRAISYVLAGGVFAAFLGPNLASWTRLSVDAAMFAGSYLSLIGLYVGSLLAIVFMHIPRPTLSESHGKGRSLRQIIRQPGFVVAVLGGMIGYGVMNLLMTATPLAMHGHGHGFEDTSFVIQWHILGMFLPSFFTGHLIKYLGVLKIMLAGGVLLVVCVGVNLLGSSVSHFWSALILLGVGWNFLFIGATHLLTKSYQPSEKAKTQGLNDLLVFGTVGITALSAGFLHHAFGWKNVNLGVIPGIGLVLIVTLWLRYRHGDWPRAGVKGQYS